MFNRTIRPFSTSAAALAKKANPQKVTRTVPYYTKGSWDLVDKPAAPAMAGAAKAAGSVPKNWRNSDLPMWKKHMFALKEKFPDGYKPLKRLSRDKIGEVRDLKRAFPELSNDDLAMRFKVSPESIRHILKSKWRPNTQEERKIEGRWKRRGGRLREGQTSS